jgi:hypothetical protein
MRYLTLSEVIELHRILIQRFGGSSGLRVWVALNRRLPSLA